ncbi:MAG: Flp pilus assembly complex ATPase component TadA [Deltaproteobacteria bacterium]|nr:Flp pilus assembly complex ATPase component TadA [Deltaproteobacteria bacterium]
MPLLKKRKPLGEILIGKKIITQTQLEQSLQSAKKTNTRVGSVLVRLGYCSEEDIARALAEQYELPYVMPSSSPIDPKTIRLIPEATARRFMAVAVSIERGALNVAMLDPLNVIAVDEIKKLTGLPVNPLVTTETEILKSINLYYGMEVSFDEMVKRVQASGIEFLKGEDELPEMLEKAAGESSIVQLVDMLGARGVMENASDIHIEPDEDTLRVRYRVDGLLHETVTLPLKIHPAVVSRVKILSDINIAEKRVPQDGRFIAKIAGRDIDVRVSTLPTIFGEKVVLRLLDKSRNILEIENLTPMPDTLEVIKKIIKRPFGLILLTGPTGSGKTTTAYTLLNMLNTMDKNLVTVEDPVEYHLKRINQVQVNTKAGVTFAGALRHILRQDPDIVMIGEIRDRETAEISIHAALTGHLVISTIHTNDAVGTVSRLLDMGIEPYLISSSVTCIVGQRLVRKICEGCKAHYDADPKILEGMGAAAGARILYKGNGCAACKGTGLKGRIGIFEVLTLDDELRGLIVAKKENSVILDALKKKGFAPLRTQGIRAAMAGHTTLEEVFQATQAVE